VSPQGKKGNPAAQGKRGRPEPAAVAAERRARQRRIGVIGFAVLLIALFAIVAVAQGIGHAEPSGDEIALIEDAGPDGSDATITTEQFDRALTQTALRNGLKEVPATDDPQYEQVKQAAIDDQILTRWVFGEAAERGITVTDREVDDRLAQVIEQQFGSQKAFEKGIEDSGFTEDEVRERIQLQLISDQIQQDVIPGGADASQQTPEQLAADAGVTSGDVEEFYEANATQFQTPESRDVRVVLTKTEAEADKALAELQSDDSPKGWEAVAKKYSIDEATKSTGGLRQQVIEGQSEPALDERIFSSPEGELVGPFEADTGFYVIEVETINPEQTTPLDCPPDDEGCTPARGQIQQTLAAAQQNQVAQSFQEDFSAKWRSRTYCADDYLIDRCANANPAASGCTEELANSSGCGAAVPSRRVIAPGTSTALGATAPTPLVQGPITPQAAAPPAQLPPGLESLPPGSAPPGTAPGG
jgi:parvulin-like peptidyl-prolyl isomerase